MSTADAQGTGRVQCLVITPERTMLDARVDFVALPLYDGELGVLPGRGPLIGRLGRGELRTRAGGVVHRYFVDSGFAQVRDDVVTVLTNRAIPAAEIDKAAAAREVQAAKDRTALGEAEQAERQQQIDRASAKLRVAEKA